MKTFLTFDGRLQVSSGEEDNQRIIIIYKHKHRHSVIDPVWFIYCESVQSERFVLMIPSVTENI